MAWLLKLSVVILVQVLKSQCNPDNVTVNFQLNSYTYTGKNSSFENPIFFIGVEENNRSCERVIGYKINDELREYTGTLIKNSSTWRHDPNGGQIKFYLERQNYKKSLILIIRQTYNNTRVTPGPEFITQYCSNVSTANLISPFNMSLQAIGCTNCSIGVTLEAECPDHCYGAQCDTYCVPTDDLTTGHHRCGPNGEKICSPGYNGTNCTHNIDDCYNITCYNGGTCQDGLGAYTCLCRDGFNGTLCEHNIDDCVNSSCQNGGTCQDRIMNYTCVCRDGFNGNHCEHNIDDCVNSPCQNGGTCRDEVMNYTCLCTAGFDGTHCEHNIDDCVNSSCQNGGTCQDGVMNYSCSCKDRFSGVHCEQAPSTSEPPVTSQNLTSDQNHHSTASTSQELSVSLLLGTTSNRDTRSTTNKPNVSLLPKKSTDIAAIAGGGTGGAVLVLAIVVVLVIKLRRRRRPQENRDQLKQSSRKVYSSTNGVGIPSNGVHNGVHTSANLQDIGVEKGYNNEIYDIKYEVEKTQL